MRVVATAWINGSPGEFEASCALSVHGKAGYQLGGTPLEVFIMSGWDRLDDAFVAHYQARGVLLRDATTISRKYVDRYSALFDQVTISQSGLYELYCFVRWLVVEEMVDGESFLHLDLDLFFQMSLDQVRELFSNVTGTFGSPCLTAVSDLQWLRTYQESLDRLVVDRVAFQKSIGWTGNEFRPNISSDQDLVDAMQRQKALPLIGISQIADRYSVFVNPLYPYYGSKPPARNFEVRSAVDFIGGKPVLFWHLQNNFADYLSRFAILQNFQQGWLAAYLPCRLCLPFIQLEPTAENFAFQAMKDYIWPIVAKHTSDGRDVNALGFEKFFSRTWLSEWFVVERQGRELFSPDYWWEDGVFSPAVHRAAGTDLVS